MGKSIDGPRKTTIKTIKNALYLSFNVFSTKVLIGGTIYMGPTGDETAIERGHSSHLKVYPFAGLREYLHFSIILDPEY